MNAADTPQPFVTAYEDAPAYWSIGILWNVLISGDESFGHFTLMDQTMPEGAGPPSHMHERMHEGFYVLEGEITYTIGLDDQNIVAGPGAAIWIPPATAHAFKVTSEQARALNFYTPGGFDDQFSYLATPATEKTLPPQDLPRVDPGQKEAYLNRLRDLHQETMLSDEQIW
ncbi:MAG: quercetin 2,3-dioxygenase [Solirubrobacteraceae bacterium]